MTLKNLPRFELCNEGSWVRLSSQFVSANFVDDCGMKRHKAALARYSTHSLASRGETKAHLELRRETDFVASSRFESFYKLYRKLGAMLYNFRKAAIEGWVPAALQGVSGSLRLCGPVALRLC